MRVKGYRNKMFVSRRFLAGKRRARSCTQTDLDYIFSIVEIRNRSLQKVFTDAQKTLQRWL